MVLTKLCDWVDDNQKEAHSLPETSVLDIGTGSGILAIAAAKLMGAQVEAIDIDTSALDNARDNAQLNGVGHLVKLSTTPLHDVTGTFQLILANIYGEVLMSMASDMNRIAQTGTTAILSGITEIVWGQVWHVYEQRDWQLISEHSEGDWMCAVIKKL